MKKLLFLALVIFSANSLLAIDEFPKDTLWRKYIEFADINSLMFSRDESKVYVNTNEGVSVLDAKTGKTIEEIKSIGNIASESQDGSFFYNYKLEKFDSKTRQLIWTCPKRDSKDFRYMTFGISENGKYIAVSYTKQMNSSNQDSTNVDIYNSETQEIIKSIKADGAFYTLTISNNFKYLLYCTYSKQNHDNFDAAVLFDINNSKVLKTLYNNKNGTGYFGVETFQINQISSQNNYAIAKWNDYITVLDLRTMNSFVYTPSGGGKNDSDVGFISPDEKLLVSGGVKNGSLELYNLEKKVITYTGSRIMKWDGSAFGVINKTNELLLMFSYNGLFMIDLNKTWTDVPKENDNGISISPNPVNNILRITNPENLIIKSIITFDMSGKNYSLTNQNNSLNISFLSKGNYFLKMILENNSILNFTFIKE